MHVHSAWMEHLDYRSTGHVFSRAKLTTIINLKIEEQAPYTFPKVITTKLVLDIVAKVRDQLPPLADYIDVGYAGCRVIYNHSKATST